MIGRLLLAGALGMLSGAAPAPSPFVIAAAADGQPRLGVRIKRADLNVRLATSFDSALILNSEPAGRAGLKAFPLVGKRSFKNAFIPGGEATFRFNLYDITPRGLPKSGVPAVWVDKPISSDSDGVLGLTGLKADHVTIELGPQAPGSRTYTLTRPDRGSVLLRARLGGETIDVALELNSPDTVMNARAADALVAAGLVKRAGTLGYWKPFPGVTLPFERLAPVAGAQLLGLPMFAPGGRISESQAKALDARAKAGTSTAEDDSDTITVTASKKRGRDPWILIGRDVLRHCSRLDFDRPAKTWALTCAFPA